MRAFHYWQPLGVSLLAFFLSVRPSLAQVVNSSPDQLHEAFRASSTRNAEVFRALTQPQAYDLGRLNQFLGALEREAIAGDPPRLRASAVVAIAMTGSRDYRAVPVPGTVDRMLRIYRQSTDELVRAIIVAMLPTVEGRTQAIPLLERIASEPPEAMDFPGAAGFAVSSLGNMDAAGLEALRRLRTSGAIRDLNARRDAEALTAGKSTSKAKE